MSTIAVIGTGISGLAAAYLLHSRHSVTVYEKSSTIGGHSRTITVNYKDRQIPVDTGFIVFNYRNYPNLAGLFKKLDVPVQKSNMSFGVTANNGTLEWGADNLNSLFGQRSNIINPTFYRFLADVLRFNRQAVKAVLQYPDITLSELLDKLSFSPWFSEYYLLPMGGAIWSCPLDTILKFPAKTFIEFFDAHGLLTVTQQPQWYTVAGGSKEYIKRLTAPFAQHIRTNCAATKITRGNNKASVTDSRGEIREFDHVILACHGDEALRLLSDITPDEIKALSCFNYQPNKVVLHCDTNIMPKRRRCWASWIYHAEQAIPKDNIAVTYWMNKLQGIDAKYPVFVTLNPSQDIKPELIFDTHIFHHPIYSMEAIGAQKDMAAIQGKNNTWFSGAYLRNGFHEDGLASAVSVAKTLGAEIPW